MKTQLEQDILRDFQTLAGVQIEEPHERRHEQAMDAVERLAHMLGNAVANDPEREMYREAIANAGVSCDVMEAMRSHLMLRGLLLVAELRSKVRSKRDDDLPTFPRDFYEELSAKARTILIGNIRNENDEDGITCPLDAHDLMCTLLMEF